MGPTTTTRPEVATVARRRTGGVRRSGVPHQRSVLPSGLRVVTQAMPHARSVAAGLFVAVGVPGDAQAAKRILGGVDIRHGRSIGQSLRCTDITALLNVTGHVRLLQRLQRIDDEM